MNYNLTHIGSINKVYGAHGGLACYFKDDTYESLVKPNTFIFLEIDGYHVPFMIVKIEFARTVIIFLEGVNSPEKASTYRQSDLFLASNQLSELPVSNLETEVCFVHYQVFDAKNNKVGIINEIIETDYSTTAIVARNGKDIFLPIHQDIILDIDHKQKVLQLEIVDGILDL